MTNYRRGQRAEWKARDLLLEQGAITVIRAAGSKGPIDLVAIGRNQTRLVQVKRGRGISEMEWTALSVLKRHLSAFYSIEVWHFIKGQRAPDVEIL